MTTKYVYPQGLAEQHPVQCRISIHKRLNKMADVVAAGADVANDASVTKAIETLTQAGKQTVNRQIIATNSTAIAQIYLYAPAGISFSDGLSENVDELISGYFSIQIYVISCTFLFCQITSAFSTTSFPNDCA